MNKSERDVDKMSREYFIAYHDYLESISELSDAECGRLFRAALEYSSTKKAIELRGNEKFLFGFIKTQIDRDNKKYAEKCDQNRNNGKLGGRPKAESNEKPNGFENNQTVSEKSERFFENLKEDKDKEEDKDKDKDNSLLTMFVMNRDADCCQCDHSKKNGERCTRKSTYEINSKHFCNQHSKEILDGIVECKVEAQAQKKKHGEFKNVLLTDEEYERLKSEYSDDLTGIIEHLSSYIEMKGYKAKSHYLAIRKWVALAFREQKSREQKFKKGQTPEDKERSYDLEEYENQMKGDNYTDYLNNFF